MALSKTTRTVFLGCLLLAPATGCGDDDDDDSASDASTMRDGGGGGGVDAGDAGRANDAGTGRDASAPTGSLDGGTSSLMSFFVSSETSMTGNLGGLTGADQRCERLAAGVGAGSKTWRAYLSVEHDPANGNNATNARDRIGDGPWYNTKGVLLAMDLASLHARKGDAEVFLDERGNKINGQWPGSPAPLEHDVLTGSNDQGQVLAGKTCDDWTSAAASPKVAQVGHSDGLGPGQDPSGMYGIWNSSHENAGCDNTAPRGGAGRIYCFAAD